MRETLEKLERPQLLQFTKSIRPDALTPDTTRPRALEAPVKSKPLTNMSAASYTELMNTVIAEVPVSRPPPIMRTFPLLGHKALPVVANLNQQFLNSKAAILLDVVTPV
jgi:hypothetical protein